MRPLRLQGYLSRGAKGYRSDRIGGRDEIRHLRHLLDVPRNVEVIFRRVTDARGRMLSVLLPGDVIIDWGDDVSYDVLRDRKVLWYRASTKAVQLDDDLVEPVVAEAVGSRTWKFWRDAKLNHMVLCDPLGRAVVLTSHEMSLPYPKLAQEAHSPVEIKRISASLALKAFHLRCWDGMGSSAEIDKQRINHAGAIAGRACKMRRELGIGALGTTCVRLYRQDDPTGWWNRLAKHIAVHGFDNDFLAAKRLLSIERPYWSITTMAEIDRLIELSGWKEWDTDDPQFVLKPSSQNDPKQKRRKPHVVTSKRGRPRSDGRESAPRRRAPACGNADPGLVQFPPVKQRFTRSNQENTSTYEEDSARSGPFPCRSRA